VKRGGSARVFAPWRSGWGRLDGMLRVAALSGQHTVQEGDSSTAEFAGGFRLVLTSPPCYHPRRQRPGHGLAAPVSDLPGYAEWTGGILLRAAAALGPDGTLCIVKTDVRYHGTILPVSFALAMWLVEHGLTLPIGSGRGFRSTRRMPRASPMSSCSAAMRARLYGFRR
jgi:hypothetical protein